MNYVRFLYQLFKGRLEGVLGPSFEHKVITFGDTAAADIYPRVRALYCGETGTLVLVSESGIEVQYSVLKGSVLPFGPLRIKDTGSDPALKGKVIGLL